MKSAAIIIALVFLLPLGKASAAGRDDKALQLEPHRLIRVLDHIHDKITRGSKSAYKLKAKMLVYIDRKFRSMAIEKWHKQSNARALVLFGLNGGNPATIQHIARTAALSAPYDKLADIVVVFAQGRTGEARALLDDVDFAGLSPTLVGPLHLIRSQVMEAKNSNAILDILRQARLFAPGTLIEETALRRSMKIAASLNDAGLAENLARHYFRRFDNSLYRDDFDRQFVRLLVAQPAEETVAMLQRLGPTLKLSQRKRQCAFYLMVSHDALLQGLLDVAAIGNDNGKKPCADHPASKAKLRIYDSASAVLHDDPDEMLDMLNGLNLNDLPKNDRHLAMAVRMMIEAIEAPLSPAQGESDVAVESAVIEQAEALLRDTQPVKEPSP